MMNIPEEMVRIKVHSPCTSLQLVEQHVFSAMKQAVLGPFRISHYKTKLLLRLIASLEIIGCNTLTSELYY